MLALDPNQHVEFWLPGDADMPADKRPTFVTKCLTARQSIKFDAFLQGTFGSQDRQKSIDAAVGALKIALVDWRHCGEPFNLDRLPDLLTYTELVDLVLEMVRAQRVKEDDLKNSDSQSGSSTDPSATTNAEAAASA